MKHTDLENLVEAAFVKIMSAWIGCITAYYVLSAILRWAKLIA